ncbi:Tetratricopeptide repeat-containing protein [Meinhardsimonia xiamenensis]|jgi:tetratricopeptide (TPR) repeat protein|uniref:Tetratricopeptide repeat-containing protein n=1 Tax=Meinhardsimonia xiamenensis TaxID=990712 RepID=A0A1G9CLZ5_9RHOB|nr:tetratricopeptide repeat protein [Meinhardsimonia xiamenensis]PRX38312.1 tetratricopeptide repeat protein [Meinhardsimonia xiamenensis]SDK52721.1 Tetratricopeptide repeat-containing protein [Meinhardsimonia xiamenensis]
MQALFAARLALCAIIVAALTGCDDPVQRLIEENGPYAPTGTPARGEAVDALVVGHRLMAAGEYELALDAYHRAALEHGLTAEVLTAIGSAELKLGRLGQAERHLRLATQRDEGFVPAWNNLGVVLMERGNHAEAVHVFRKAFALDAGSTPQIRENLALALAKQENPGYDDQNTGKPALLRRGEGDYLLLAPD